MLNKTSKFVAIFSMAILIAAGLSCAQEENSNEQNHSDIKDHNMNHETMMDSSNMKNVHQHSDRYKMMSSDNNKMAEDIASIIREGIIDLAAIDENDDGKVYQDMMDWNVISDEPGECPLCGMKLKVVPLEEAKENLIKNDFKVKENE